MQTLQILDGTETFLCPLEGRTIVLGSAADAGVRLQSSGVVARHARIDFEAGVPWLQALDGHVTIDGRAVQRAALALGDRIEIGTAVLVIGRSVTRANEPDDVLDTPRAARARATSRPRRGWLVPVSVAGAAALGLIAYLVFGGSGIPSAHYGFSELDRLRRAGSFELARAQVERLQKAWATDDQRRALLGTEVEKIERLAAIVQQRQQLVQEQAGEKTYAQLSEALQAEERTASEEEQRLAARIVRSSLSDLLRTARANLPQPPGVPPVARDERTVREPDATGPAAPVAAVPTPVVTAPKPASDQPSVPSPAAETPSPAATVTNADVTAVLADTTALVAQGRFRQALELLQLAAAGAAAADQPLLQQRASDLRRTAHTAADQLVAGARTAAAEGRAAMAITELEASAPRFPTGPEFEVLPRAIAELREKMRADAAIAAAASAPSDEASRRAAIAEVAPLLEQIRVGENAGDFAGAAALLQRAAAAVRAPDPVFAGRLQDRAAEFEDLARLHRRTAEYLGNGKEIEVALRTGETGQLRSVDGLLLLVRMQNGDASVSWFDLGTDGVKRIAQDLQLGGQQDDRAALGAAVLLYRGEAPADAEALLAKVLQQDRGLKGDVDRTIARGRGEYSDPRGYTLGGDGFAGVAAAEAQKAAQKVLARIDSVVRGRDTAAREAMLRDALALGPASLPALVAAFEQRLGKEVRQLDASPLRKQLEKLAAQRRLLDEARTSAKELIYDEAKYFYPYAPPQVSSDRYAEYNRVQAEVERRVAALRSLWDDDRLRLRVPASLAEGIGRIDWLASVLSELGELDPSAGFASDWARTLPRGEAVTIQNFCATAAERAELDEWRRIEARNTEVLAKLPASVKEQVLITNDYRAMFRHRPLAVDERLCAAAGGHADEMSKLGYFSHFSPTAGRRTPNERMRLCGYVEGVSENIALCDSASSAHLAWCRSSGHHRNLLMASHTEVGIGGNGRYWVQNFGHGTSYRDPLPKGR